MILVKMLISTPLVGGGVCMAVSKIVNFCTCLKKKRMISSKFTPAILYLDTRTGTRDAEFH